MTTASPGKITSASRGSKRLCSTRGRTTLAARFLPEPMLGDPLRADRAEIRTGTTALPRRDERDYGAKRSQTNDDPYSTHKQSSFGDLRLTTTARCGPDGGWAEAGPHSRLARTLHNASMPRSPLSRSSS